MSIYFDAATLSFFLPELHGETIPLSSVEISSERHVELLAQQSLGKRIVAGADGYPLVEERRDSPLELLQAEIARKRFQVESSGVSLFDTLFDTSRDGQVALFSAVLTAQQDPLYLCRWKAASGFIELNSEQIIEVARSVRAHTQACFDREAELLEHLENGTFTESMLDQGWPA